MNFDFMFFFNSVLIGAGLAMDAFSVSLANGLNEPKMKTGRASVIAGVFAFFQFFMPLMGYMCVHTVAKHFKVFEKLIPYIALVLLLFIGIKMLIEGIKESGEEQTELKRVGFTALIVQGIATSIDALSVGFTISNYNVLGAFVCGIIIAIVTFIICMAGLFIGKKFGTALAGKAGILGGLILIFIGIEIFVKGVF